MKGKMMQCKECGKDFTKIERIFLIFRKGGRINTEQIENNHILCAGCTLNFLQEQYEVVLKSK